MTLYIFLEIIELIVALLAKATLFRCMNYIEGLGILGGALTSVAFIPQILRIRKTKSTKDLSWGTFLTFSIGVVFWLIYGILINELPVILANTITLIFCLTIIFYKLKYRD